MFVASNGIKTAVILEDSEPLHPRLDQDNLGKMICWHRRHNLGDQHDFESPHEFASTLAYEHVALQDLLKAIHAGELKDLRLYDAGDYYQVQVQEHFGRGTSNWGSTEWTLDHDLNLFPDHDPFMAKEDLLDYLSTEDLIQLCDKSNEVAILPLFLYDHSGLALSSGSFVGRAVHAEWDSGQVGFIYMDKDTAIREMAIPNDSIRLAMRLDSKTPSCLSVAEGETLETAMEREEFTPVRKEDIVSLDATDPNHPGVPILDSHLAEGNLLYKKGHRIYLVEPQADDSFLLHSIASFNPGYSPLTEQTWKSRALEALDGEVKEYDSFLQGEVYGFQAYEGLEEVDSCWGYNPAGRDIREFFEDMFGDWGAELQEQMLKADYDYHPTFDIAEYLETHDFPELRDKILEEVKSFIQFERDTSKTYPFGMSPEQLLANHDEILDQIVEDLYQHHCDLSTDLIYEVIQTHAGVSRELQPKLRMEDLEPNRDYTVEELAALAEKKGSLSDKIQEAASRQTGTAENKQDVQKEYEHD